MDEVERYEFDRQGFIVIKDMLDTTAVAALAKAVDMLEEHALPRTHEPPRKKSPLNVDYHANSELGYHGRGSADDGDTLIIEDFWNATTAFDLLLDHKRTMDYIGQIVQGRVTINNSEIRIRYRGNSTGVHMGGPLGGKHRYSFHNGNIDCAMVRMVYFLQDVDDRQGAFCVVPGSHKSNFPPPYKLPPEKEPGMVGIPVAAGDAILFTENLRHGGLPNQSEQVRKTLHVGYGPFWMMSQNIATMDEPQFITDATRARLSDVQRALFAAWIVND
jgi:hypothetical protein